MPRHVKDTPSATKPVVLRFNRLQFISWAGGLLLDRDAQGRCFIADQLSFENSESHLDSGGIIYLTDHTGQDVSKMQLNVTKDAYEEIAL
jgi:hypothetical protein